MMWRCYPILMMFACVPIFVAGPAAAQELTADPSAWRPMKYADLQSRSKETATFSDIWQDAIEDNNRIYVDKGDHRYGSGNAPVTESHFVIWSARKSVVMSVLNTATGCIVHQRNDAAGAVVKKCPMRIAIYEGTLMRTFGGGTACFLELGATSRSIAADPARSVAYAAYDMNTKSIRTGMIVDHKAVDGCSSTIPIQPQ